MISFLLLPFQGCLKDTVSPPVNITLNTSALVLRYFEEQGDYFNSRQMPSVVGVDEVYNNLGKYLVVDVRTSAEYSAGHISGALNISNDTLVKFMNNNNVSNYPKVVIVSQYGQSASYYTCLLRLYGFNNVYALLFGMGEWNNDFSTVWMDTLGYFIGYTNFTNTKYPKLSRSALPAIPLNDSKQSLQEKIKNRIDGLIKQGFTHNTNYLDFADMEMERNQYYLVCFGRDSLYYHDKEGEPYSGHFPNTVYYNPAFDVRSSTNLQTFPPDSSIFIYSVSGHLSAFLEAYLRVLGYDAKSLIFGAGTMFQFYLQRNIKIFTPFVYLSSNIRNYPYTVGDKPQ